MSVYRIVTAVVGSACYVGGTAYAGYAIHKAPEVAAEYPPGFGEGVGIAVVGALILGLVIGAPGLWGEEVGEA